MPVLFLSPAGRIGPRTFLVAAMTLVITGLCLALVPVLGTIAGLLLMWPWCCIASRRLHDMGRAATLAYGVAAANLVVGAIAAALAAIAGASVAPLVLLPLLGLFALVTTALMLASLGFLVWLATARGDGDNRFGPTAPDRGLAALIG